ncbi:MAG TPA: lipid II flippase MurJ, partial [Elusimicrobiota bacterium]|nr:lipid II flippase MurJ [Elusimicrobiota bacterium]
SLVKVVVTAFYAQKDTRTPVRVATLCLFINMVGNVVFMHYWGVGGLAFATTLASFVNVGVLVHFLRKKIGLMGGRRIGASVLQMAGASLAMAGVSLALLRWAPGALALRTLAAVGGGAVVYIGLTRLLKMDEYAQMMSLLRRRRGGSAALAD